MGIGVIPAAQQTAWELQRMLDLVIQTKPDRILEIGIYEGGTLWYWLKLADSVTAIDDTMRPPGVGAWKTWADHFDTDLVLLHGRSEEIGIIESARRYGPYQFCLIDADHSYESVRADWDNYREMIEPGGIVCFHDILLRPGYGVDQLWSEIKSEPARRTLEIVEAGNASSCGIGAVWM